MTPEFLGSFFLSTSAGKDKDPHFSLDELQKSRPRGKMGCVRHEDAKFLDRGCEQGPALKLLLSNGL
jgi:hypothetical protein